jgi:probable rRNA maturation factor
VLALAGRPEAELSVLLCDDRLIRELNAAYRGRDSATDVLSFSMDEGPVANPNPHLLGDVVVSVETASRGARRRKRKTVDEVTSLLVHGVLHLLGYDHRKESDSRRMLALAQRIEEGVLGGAGRRPNSLYPT